MESTGGVMRGNNSECGIKERERREGRDARAEHLECKPHGPSCSSGLKIQNLIQRAEHHVVDGTKCVGYPTRLSKRSFKTKQVSISLRRPVYR